MIDLISGRQFSLMDGELERLKAHYIDSPQAPAEERLSVDELEYVSIAGYLPTTCCSGDPSVTCTNRILAIVMAREILATRKRDGGVL